jgi:3-oxoacyl-[acyl-carrier-protein] synthase I
MSAHHLAILNTGLVTSVGLTAAESCAAFRAKISNPTETRFIDSGGEWIMAHQVRLEHPWRGLTKLAKMAAMAIDEALQGVPKKEWGQLPLLLCVAETERPGRMAGLEDDLFLQIQTELGVNFAAQSAVVTQGHVGVAVALARARTLMGQTRLPRVLVAAADSLVNWPTLRHFDENGRLLAGENSNGFMAGEGAGALLLCQQSGMLGELVCGGIGFGREEAHLESDSPLRAEGLLQAIGAALAEAGSQMHDMDFRISDASGEHYYFKEATLALLRTLRGRKEEFDIWHPAECTGDVGAVVGMTIIALAKSAADKGYARGSKILAHMSNDAGQRAALALAFNSAQ